MRGWWVTLVLLCAACCAACGARSGLLASDGARPCTHPAVVESCSDGWCKVPAGCFESGDQPGEPPCSYPGVSPVTRRQVRLTRAFALAQHEVTQLEFQTVMGYHPFAKLAYPERRRKRYCDDCPAYWVEWSTAVAYCDALSLRSNYPVCSSAEYRGNLYSCPGYRLPTEAEWEYAYRAGTATALYSGPLTECADDRNASLIGWNVNNAIDGTDGLPIPREVGQKVANGWGLHDMAGNVEEYVHDEYVDYTDGAELVDPQGGEEGEDIYKSAKVAKGGAVVHAAVVLRAAFRERVAVDWTGHGFYGIRCARTLP